MKLSRLVDLVAEVTGETYSYSPGELDATVTLRAPDGLAKEQLPGLLSHVLASRGFATVRTAGSPILSVVKIDQAAGLVATGAEGATDAAGAGFVTLTIAARHVPAKALAESLKAVVSKPGGAVTVIGDSNLIAVSDYVARLEEVGSLARRIDAPDTTAVHEIPLRFLPAQQAAALVTQIASKREAAGGRKLKGDVIVSSTGTSLLLISPPDAETVWRELIGIIDRREPVETKTYTPQFFGAREVAKLLESTMVGAGITAAPAQQNSPAAPATGVGDDRWRVVVDELTGSLIITATAAQHEKVAELLTRLDSTDRTPMPVRAFPIRNRPVNDLLATLHQLIAAGALEVNGDERPAAMRNEVSAGASQSSYRTPFPPPTGLGPAQDSTRPLVVVEQEPEVRTSLTQDGRMASGGSRKRDSLALTADESTNTLIAIGEPRVLTQLGVLLETLDVRQPQVMLEAVLVSLTDSEALNLGVELENLIGIGDTTIKLASLFGLSSGGPTSGTVPVGPGFNGVVLNPGEFGMVVKALESLNRGKSLSVPRLLVTNNEQAIFSSVLQQPITQQTRTGSNDTTFSYGGSESAGTTISVKPQIAQGDHLVLTYSIKLSNFVGSSGTSGLPPPKQENSVDSVATIPDGFSIAVGGLDLLNETESESRVPLIGEIPIVGELFKSRNNGSGRTRFFVFIHATVLRSSGFEDLRYISARETARFQVDDGWPEVEPRYIR